MRKFLSLLMGLDECASPAELRRQYQKLITGLVAAEYDCSPDQLRRYLTARERLGLAYEKAKKQLRQSEEMHGSVTGSGLLLGELLLDAGIISQEQLNDALAVQSRSKPPLPIGRILVGRKLITWEELAFYLKLQELLQLPTGHCNRLSRQLVELGLATRAEMNVAELDCETTGCSLFHAVSRRAWIKPSILALLTGGSDKPASDAAAKADPAPTVAGKAISVAV
jgi:hypothetical protein